MRVWCHSGGVFKGVCCRISSRPISWLYGANYLKRSMLCQRHITNALGKHYTLSLLFWGLK
ncbi:hypothetical protein HMPREF1430_01384 [Helicobacter pylori GAM96Ai]|nr:hypothetical protein HMPREF1430_01384 [Helicobacter pylori GAM96Ai]